MEETCCCSSLAYRPHAHADTARDEAWLTANQRHANQLLRAAIDRDREAVPMPGPGACRPARHSGEPVNAVADAAPVDAMVDAAPMHVDVRVVRQVTHDADEVLRGLSQTSEVPLDSSLGESEVGEEEGRERQRRTER